MNIRTAMLLLQDSLNTDIPMARGDMESIVNMLGELPFDSQRYARACRRPSPSASPNDPLEYEATDERIRRRYAALRESALWSGADSSGETLAVRLARELQEATIDAQYDLGYTEGVRDALGRHHP